jgi:prepilin-type N-terminal cleavage/methylation domain-containing protein
MYNKFFFRNPQSAIRNGLGFSFVELMVVVAIMSILIIASLPVFRNFAKGRSIDDAALTVVSSLKKTREASITYRKNYRTVLDTVKQAVAIYDNEDKLAEKWQGLPEFVEFDTSSSDWYTGDAGPYQNEYPGENKYWIQFKPSGAVDRVGFDEQRVVLMEESTSDTRVVKVNALTGKVEVEE